MVSRMEPSHAKAEGRAFYIECITDNGKMHHWKEPNFLNELKNGICDTSGVKGRGIVWANGNKIIQVF